MSEIILETIQSILDENFVDAHTNIQTIMAGKVKERLDVLRESTATTLYSQIKKQID